MKNLRKEKSQKDNSSNRPTLGVFIFGVPEFETLFHLLNRLNERGALDLKIYMTSSVFRIEPRALQLLKQARLQFRILPSKALKYLYWRHFHGMDAVLMLADPQRDSRAAHRRRNNYMIHLELPTIFMQHGVLQAEINGCFPDEKIDFYSIAALLMEYPPENLHRHFSAAALARVKVSGFVKKRCFEPNPLSPDISGQLSKYDLRLLICHSLRSTMHGSDQIRPFYSMVEKFADAHPNIGVIVRPHRGKRRKEYESYDRKLAKKCGNVHFMYHHHGPLKRMSITDAIHICDAVISTPSTAILDAIYMGTPTAVCLNFHPIFSELPQITDSDSIERFISNSHHSRASAESLITRYGDCDENIDRTCFEVEKILTQLPRRN